MVKRYDILPELGCMHFYEDGDYILYKDYAALESKVAGLEKDAARYNWIMDYDDFEEVIEVLSLGSDDAIDRAMGREA